MLNADWSASRAPEIRLNEELIVPMELLRHRPRACGSTAEPTGIFPLATDTFPDPVHHLEIGSGGPPSAPENRHVCARLARLAFDIAFRHPHAGQITVESLAGKRQILEPAGIKPGQCQRCFD